MNINDEEIDLGLVLGSSYYSARTRLNSSSGAGVNADSKVDMAFAASDPLSELVWSPHRGLSLKCADSSLANKNPSDRWKVGLNVKDPANSPCIKSNGSRDGKTVDQEKLTISHAMLDGDDKSGDRATLLRSSGGSSGHELSTCCGQYYDRCKHKMEEGGTADAIQAENTRDNGEKVTSSHNVQIVDIAESSKKNAEQDIFADGTCDNKVKIEMKWESQLNRRICCSPENELEFDASNSGVMGLALPIRSEPHAVNLSEAPIDSLPRLMSQQEPDDEVTSSFRDVYMNKSRKPNAIPEPTLMRFESSAENILGHMVTKETHSINAMGISRENSCPIDRSPADSRSRLYKEKGKAKALSDGNIYGRSDDEDDSNKSMESCNSVGVVSKGKKRLSYNQDQLVGSKRLKKQIQGIHGSTSIVRLDSSFMNWISNMVKGLSDSNKDPSSRSLTLPHSSDVCCNNHQEDFMYNKPQDCESPKMGFQTMFQSLYLRNTKILCSGIQRDNCSINESKELTVSEKKPLENVPRLCDKNTDNTCKQIMLSDKVNNRSSTDFASMPHTCESSLAENKVSNFPIHDRAKGEETQFGSCKMVNSAGENSVLDTPMPISCLPAKSSPLSSLWITRLYTKQLEKGNQVTEEVREFSPEFEKASVGLNSTCKLSSLQFPQKMRTSEAMSSVFAKRLDAFRHIIHPPEKIKSRTCAEICFFCGRSTHDLRSCPELTETELNDLLLKLSAFDRVEESPSFCIRCFQFDHWANSCPSLCSQIQSQSQLNVCDHHSTFRLQLHAINDGGEEDDHKQASAGHVASTLNSLRKRLPTSNEFQRSTTSNSENDLKNVQKFLPFNFIHPENATSQEEKFSAITKLRLSRADVLRWMSSNVSLSHLNGFFVRLRVGRFQAGLSGTGYYAARITGNKIESAGSEYTKSILVDVGGIKSTIGSQYVSNHDFLEDEVKGWWSRIVKAGGSIPSMDELNSKFKERKCLGF